jgi:predicted dehydrogenase
MPHGVAIVGFGKIAEDQHVPSIAAIDTLELAATVSRQGKGVADVPSFTSIDELLAADLGLAAVAVCTPPSARYAIARRCIEAGLHTLLEKPPGVSLGEVEELARLAQERGIVLFTTWHAQHNPAVAAAAERLQGKRMAEMRIVWREDVRKWHPGQQWIWEPGGFGVFDPGINALSIATRIFPGALFVREAELRFPENRAAPIAASLTLESPAGGSLSAEFDWRHSGGEEWTITVRTDDGEHLVLRDGGSKLEVGGESVAGHGPGEYPSIYQDFAALIESGRSHVDLTPLRLTADAFMLGRHVKVEAFED